MVFDQIYCSLYLFFIAFLVRLLDTAAAAATFFDYFESLPNFKRWPEAIFPPKK